jgi:hypothetical protein
MLEKTLKDLSNKEWESFLNEIFEKEEKAYKKFKKETPSILPINVLIIISWLTIILYIRNWYGF